MKALFWHFDILLPRRYGWFSTVPHSKRIPSSFRYLSVISLGFCDSVCVCVWMWVCMWENERVRTKNEKERNFDFSVESSAPNLAYISPCLHVALRACLPANQPTNQPAHNRYCCCVIILFNVCNVHIWMEYFCMKIGFSVRFFFYCLLFVVVSYENVFFFLFLHFFFIHFSLSIVFFFVAVGVASLP